MYLKQDFRSSFRILKGGKISLVVSAILGSVIVGNASPSGGVVTSGNATINQNGNTTNINQSSQKASINWQDFSIAKNETVNFNQPNSSSITLNRVIGNEKSIIDGALNANGQVWILNSNGTLFGKNAKVNTSGLLVTTKNLSDDDFQKGNYNFKGNSKESIENQGEINLNDKAYAVFVANSVINNGEIKVHKGTVHLIGADEFSLTLNENSNISLKVTKGTLNSLVENNNLIVANGGNVYLTTNAKNELLKGVVNNSGIIEAASLDDLQSEVILFAHGGTANISGEIKAKNSFVETSGENLSVKDSFKITANTWLLDPVNITIEANGGSDFMQGSVSATAIQNALAGTNLELQADNNITVNQNITWSEATQLRLTADNINVNATINNTNQTNGGVYFNAANRSNKVVFGINGKVVVNNINQMQWINTALNGKYELGSNINASATSTWNSNGSGGYYGFNSIGDDSTLDNNSRFTGTFDGKGFAISDLYINRPITDQVGLFGYIHDATIKNIGLENVSITGGYWVGGLVGFNRQGTIQNSHVTGAVSGSYRVGGLVGNNYYGQIENSYALGSVSGTQSVGGLVGLNDSSGTITINNSYAISSVTGSDYIGGFVGSNYNGTIENSYASGTTTAVGSDIGGLMGFNTGYISNSWYDKDTNNGVMSDTYLGKTKAEIVNLLTGTEWTTNSSQGRGYSLDGTTDLPFLKNVTKLSNSLFESGLGTVLNPFTITNWTQLQNINNSNILTQNYYFNLLNNLDNSTADYFTFNSGLGWNPIGDNSTLDNNSRFIGTFDGLGHTISDLYLSRSGTSNVGLFGASANGSIIENLGLLSTTIYGNYYVGAIAGRNYGTISNSYTTGNVSGSLDVGGLSGRNYGTILNSYTLADVTGIDLTGGLVGYNFGGTISNSYASGTVTGTYNIGGLVGNNTGTITNSFYDNEANTSTSMSDTSRGRTKAEILALVGSPWSNAIWGITAGGTSVEGYEAVLLPYLIGVTREEDKSKSILFAGGFGTSNDAYEITNWTQLQNINNLGVLNQNYYFKLLNNLDSQTSDYTNLASSTANGGLGWRSIGNNSTFDDNSRFRGTFDGQGNTISDLYIKQLTGQSASNVGLFGYITTGATIQNIGLLNVDITGLYSVGGLLGYNNGGTIENSYVTGIVNGTQFVGGLVGYNFLGTIKSSYFSGIVSGTHQIGGLTGRNYTASINNSYAIGSVTASGGSAGGLVGANEIGATITNSYASGTVNGVGNIGGLTGFNAGVGIINNSFYDTDKHLGTAVGLGSLDGITGKTTAQLEDINTFLNAGWSITEDDTLLKGTPILVNGQWRIGTKVIQPQLQKAGFEIPYNMRKIVDSIDDSLTVKISSPTKTLPNIKIVDGGIRMPDDVVLNNK